MANYNDGVCEDLETFSNIRYTPAWYYKKWPGFLNVEFQDTSCLSQGVRTEEELLEEQRWKKRKERNMRFNLSWKLRLDLILK